VVFEKTVYRDIAVLYQIKNPQYLENILLYIAQNNCQTTSFNKIAQTLSISTDTVINLIYYLESTYLIGNLPIFSKNVNKQIRSNKKFFIIDSGLRKRRYSLHSCVDVLMSHLILKKISVTLTR
jgi:predicted AAA+ superfamily ATPase